MTLPVCERFLSWQGEGASVGSLAYFIRLQGCNLSCTWCDSKYALTGHGKKEEVSQIIGEIHNYCKITEARPLVVITGGEPLLHAVALHPLIEELQDGLGLGIEIETNGTLAPMEWEDVVYNVSPKLYSSGNPPEKVIDHDILGRFADLTSIFKFVVKTWKDWKEMDQVITAVGIPKEFVYVMPEGRSAEAIKKHVWKFKDDILRSGYNLSPRMHIEYFGNKRRV